MIVRDIYLIRHGETDYNEKKIVQGEGVDAPLNEAGHQQALAFYESYGHFSFDKIYTSTLKRAHQTVLPFIQNGNPLEKHPGLNEINWGHYEGRPVAQEQRDYYKNLLQTWREGFTHIPIFGGESPEDVAEKQKPVLKKIINSPEEQRILICMHGRAMRVLLCQLMKKPLKAMDEFQHGNLSLYHLGIDEQNEVQLLKANCQEHLLKADSQTSMHV